MSRARQAKDKEELRISRLVPRSAYDFSSVEMNIYDDKVAYFSVKENLAIIIKSQDSAQNMRSMYEMCWKMAELLSKKGR